MLENQLKHFEISKPFRDPSYPVRTSNIKNLRDEGIKLPVVDLWL